MNCTATKETGSPHHLLILSNDEEAVDYVEWKPERHAADTPTYMVHHNNVIVATGYNKTDLARQHKGCKVEAILYPDLPSYMYRTPEIAIHACYQSATVMVGPQRGKTFHQWIYYVYSPIKDGYMHRRSFTSKKHKAICTLAKNGYAKKIDFYDIDSPEIVTQSNRLRVKPITVKFFETIRGEYNPFYRLSTDEQENLLDMLSDPDGNTDIH